MEAIYFLILLWFFPLQLCISVTAERIARAAGAPSGDWFLRALFIGYPALASLSDIESEVVFRDAIPRYFRKWIFILVGCPNIALLIMLLAYLLPYRFDSMFIATCIVQLIAWSLGAYVLCAVLSIKGLHFLQRANRGNICLAIFGHAGYLLHILSELRTVPGGLSELEFRCLRNLLITVLPPLVLLQLAGSLAGLLTAGLLLGTLLKSGITDGIYAFTVVLFVVAILSALVISPWLCYYLSERKGYNTLAWTPTGFALPVVSSLVLLILPSHSQKNDSVDEVVNDWALLLALISQFGLAGTYAWWVMGWPDYQVNSVLMGAWAMLWFMLCVLAPLMIVRVRFRVLALRKNEASNGSFAQPYALAGIAATQLCSSMLMLILSTVRYVMHAAQL